MKSDWMGCVNNKQSESSTKVNNQQRQFNRFSCEKSKNKPLNRASAYLEKNESIAQQPNLVDRKLEHSQSFTTFRQFLKQIQQELKENQKIYGQFLSTEITRGIISEFTKRYRNQSEAVQLVTMLIDFMSFCKNKNECIPPLQTNFTEDYIKQIALQWQKIRQPSYFFNKGHLKLLNYIVDSRNSENKQYSHCFQSLKFDLSIQQARKVAEVVKKMMRDDIRAFSYLSNYFYSSCVRLDRENHTIRQIDSKYWEVLIQLCIENPPAPPIKQSDAELSMHPSFINSDLIPNLSLDLRNFKSEVEKQFGLEAFIMTRADESLMELDRFNLILKQLCYKNNGFHFKSEVKIKNREQTKALSRIKEKMLGTIYEQVELEKQLSSSIKDQNLSNFIDLYSYTAQQYSEYKQKMKKIFNKANEPISFKVSDLLRGKCVFTSVNAINRCCQSIIEEINRRRNEGLKLIEIDNRLSKPNSDLVMKILFKNTIAELQLVKDLNTAEYQFSHKLFQLKRSKFFTPLTQLSIFNEEISKNYLLESRAMILSNIGNRDDYNQKITYQQPLHSFRQFLRKLQIKINLLETHPNEIQIKTMKQQQKRFKNLRQAKVKIRDKQVKWLEMYEITLNKGNYHYQMKEYEIATKELQSAIKIFEKNNKEMIQNFLKGKKTDDFTKRLIAKYTINLGYSGMNYADMGRYEQALERYDKQISIRFSLNGQRGIQTASTLNNIGSVYFKQGNLQQALKNYNKCLDIQQRASGKININTVGTLNNVALIYHNQGKYAQALKNYQKSLAMEERIKGKESFNTITLNNIGNLHNMLGNYSLALQYLKKCLEIQEKLKGQGSIDTASLLKNIGLTYDNLENYPLALKSYMECLEIEEKIKGKESIDTASTFNNIGMVYSKQKKFKEALQNYKKCLQIEQKITGKGNIDTASTLNNIGLAYSDLENDTEAIKYYEQAVAIYEKLGAKYQQYKTVLANLNLVKSRKKRLVPKKNKLIV